jgi:hypothetical protein
MQWAAQLYIFILESPNHFPVSSYVLASHMEAHPIQYKVDSVSRQPTIDTFLCYSWYLQQPLGVGISALVRC